MVIARRAKSELKQNLGPVTWRIGVITLSTDAVATDLASVIHQSEFVDEIEIGDSCRRADGVS